MMAGGMGKGRRGDLHEQGQGFVVLRRQRYTRARRQQQRNVAGGC